MKIVTVIGARPQFVKAAAVSRAVATHNATIHDPRSTIHEVIIHTGQHFDANMSDVFFDEMKIPKPDCFLDINSMSHGAIIGKGSKIWHFSHICLIQPSVSAVASVKLCGFARGCDRCQC